MSYTISLDIDTGAPEPFEVWSTNYTSNCAPMWREADPERMGLARFNGWNAGAAADALALMIWHMEQRPDDFKKLNPPNGWGDFDSQLRWLHELRHQMRRHHRSTVRVYR